MKLCTRPQWSVVRWIDFDDWNTTKNGSATACHYQFHEIWAIDTGRPCMFLYIANVYYCVTYIFMDSDVKYRKSCLLQKRFSNWCFSLSCLEINVWEIFACDRGSFWKSKVCLLSSPYYTTTKYSKGRGTFSHSSYSSIMHANYRNNFKTFYLQKGEVSQT